MAGRKMAKKKKKKRKKNAAGSLGRLALILAFAAVVALAAVKYAATPRGEAFLLDLGFDRHYEEVQSGIGALIEKGALEAGMQEGAISLSKADGGTGPGPVVDVKGDLPAGRSLLQLNVEIDRAVRKAGGRVKTCVEKRGGRVIEMGIGTRRVVTHRCVFRIGRRAARKPEGPLLAVIVDDFGYFNNRLVREFLGVEVPFTVAVIPGLRHSEKICRQAREAGKEVICHLPMEPESGSSDEGEIPLVLTSMSGREIEKMVERSLESTPGVAGMNNHMGSKATADSRVMKSVLKVCRRKDLFFVDSYTTSKSVVTEAAARAGVRSIRNDIFLDNKGEDIRENMRKILSIASRKGKATAIMHIRKGNADHLRWLAEEAAKEGVRIVKLSDVIGS
jgi:polysaccharide deacetylase 2 family uncharacterized protein YibQ